MAQGSRDAVGTAVLRSLPISRCPEGAVGAPGTGLAGRQTALSVSDSPVSEPGEELGCHSWACWGSAPCTASPGSGWNSGEGRSCGASRLTLGTCRDPAKWVVDIVSETEGRACSALECGEGYFSWCMEGKPMRRCTNIRPGETGMDVTSRCTLGDPNKLPEGVPQPARMPYISDKHPRQTLEVINLLRKHRELCDVVLVVGAKKIYAHRVILSACSPYFRAMFTGELAESRQTEVVIRDIDERAMELLIDFAYTSQITVEEGNVQTLLPAACLLQLAEIQEACCEFLKRQLDPSNCLGIRAFADTHSCRELLRIADKFTQHNFQEVMESEEFMLLPANQLIDIISSDELNVRSEEQVFNAVMAWVKYSIQERRPQLPQVLQHVRLPLLSPKFLVGTVGSDPLIKSDEECRDLVDEAKNYLLLPQERPLMQGPRTRPRKPIRCGEVLFAGSPILVPVRVVDIDCQAPSSSFSLRYDPKTNQWSSDVAPTSTCRTSVGVAVLGGFLYAVGGQDGVSCLNIVERYDPKENKWTRVASMSTRRLGVAVAVLGGFLYAVGGSDGTSPLNTVERYNPQENRWHTIAPMGTRRKHLGCAVYQDMIYAVGGRDDTTELSSAERYNPRTNQWSPVVAMTSRRSGVGLAVVNGQLMAVGGFDGTTYLKTIEVFDPDANTWRLYGGMNYRRLGGGVGVIKMTHCESHIW
ncbi:kelch-like protein 20 [Orycteropus afer afer]|uniref:Kelch-like protein 20 n=1 Tax=Orycteropus afer afer TaxID=1230840 RepID=A0AC54Z575_ORYAF|nr:kelch-like protein 20 [Orycteropus afer afer]